MTIDIKEEEFEVMSDVRRNAVRHCRLAEEDCVPLPKQFPQEQLKQRERKVVEQSEKIDEQPSTSTNAPQNEENKVLEAPQFKSGDYEQPEADPNIFKEASSGPRSKWW